MELFLNGASLGKQPMKRNSKLSWQVKYAPGTLSAKGFNGGKVVAEQKIETTGDAVAVKLTRDLTGLAESLKADGKDLAVFTVSATDAQGRPVPVAQNKISFALEGAGKILGVGNGDPSSHEPDVFVAQAAVRSVPVNDWRWQMMEIPSRTAAAPEYAPGFDDSGWNKIRPKTDGDTGYLVLRDWQKGVFRAHVQLTEADLASPGVLLRFGGVDDEGWLFVNNQFLGESHDCQDQPCFDAKTFLHPGDHIIAVAVRNNENTGGLNPDVNVELVSQAGASAWSRSLFNGLAQIIVQSSKTAGEIKLTATADGLTPATAAVQTQHCTPRPSVP